MSKWAWECGMCKSPWVLCVNVMCACVCVLRLWGWHDIMSSDVEGGAMIIRASSVLRDKSTKILRSIRAQYPVMYMTGKLKFMSSKWPLGSQGLLGVLLLAEVHKSSNEATYLQVSTGRNVFQGTMSLQTFQMISRDLTILEQHLTNFPIRGVWERPTLASK